MKMSQSSLTKMSTDDLKALSAGCCLKIYEEITRDEVEVMGDVFENAWKVGKSIFLKYEEVDE